MVFKLSIKKMLKPIIRLSVVVFIVFLVGFLYAGGYNESLLPGFIIIICIPVLPTIYLLVEYFIATRNQTIKIENNVITVIYKNGDSDIYHIENLKCIKLYKSAGMEKGRVPYQTAEMYYHAEIITNDDKKIIITSVINPSIEEALSMIKGINIEVKRTIYSTIYI